MRLRDRTDRVWFSHPLRHPARKWSGSILSTPEPARGEPSQRVDAASQYSITAMACSCLSQPSCTTPNLEANEFRQSHGTLLLLQHAYKLILGVLK